MHIETIKYDFPSKGTYEGEFWVNIYRETDVLVAGISNSIVGFHPTDPSGDRLFVQEKPSGKFTEYPFPQDVLSQLVDNGIKMVKIP